MQGPPACGNVPTLTISTQSRAQIDGEEGTSVLAWLTILLGDGHCESKNTRELAHVREQTSQPTSCHMDSNRHDENILQRKVKLTKPRNRLIMESLIRQRRLRLFGLLPRMPSSLPVRRVYDFNPNIHGCKRPIARRKTRSVDSNKHDLNSAGLDTTNAAQMVFDRPEWKVIVSGLPTLEPEHGD